LVLALEPVLGVDRVLPDFHFEAPLGIGDLLGAAKRDQDNKTE
jgi:hypothetical protein